MKKLFGVGLVIVISACGKSDPCNIYTDVKFAETVGFRICIPDGYHNADTLLNKREFKDHYGLYYQDVGQFRKIIRIYTKTFSSGVQEYVSYRKEFQLTLNDNTQFEEEKFELDLGVSDSYKLNYSVLRDSLSIHYTSEIGFINEGEFVVIEYEVTQLMTDTHFVGLDSILVVPDSLKYSPVTRIVILD